MSDKEITVFQCGPKAHPCKCECGPEDRKNCDHDWNGPWIQTESGGSASCSKCGLNAMEHDLWAGW